MIKAILITIVTVVGLLLLGLKDCCGSYSCDVDTTVEEKDRV